MSTFDDIPAFIADWNNSGHYIGHFGFGLGTSGTTYGQYSSITVQFAERKSGNTDSHWSFIGVYGWTDNPYVEWYIIDDSFDAMPIEVADCSPMSNSPVQIDGGSCTLCMRPVFNSSGDRCGGRGLSIEYYSIRHNNNPCGQISVTEHFKAWSTAGNLLGNLNQVSLFLEIGAGQGTLEFPITNVLKTQ
jgi:hypothetical protein